MNGSLGEVVSLGPTTVRVRLETGTLVTVEPAEWQQIEYAVDVDEEGDDTIGARVVGRFRQIPLQLAWTVTLHKSQGLTFDRVHGGLGGGAFAAAQAYGRVEPLSHARRADARAAVRAA